jgi:glycosyltransferase involved in cell wall biosynthesis
LIAVASHPVQYQTPWFRALAQREEFEFEVAYVAHLDPQEQGTGFERAFAWDLDLLSGYRSRCLVTRRSAAPSWRRRLIAPCRQLAALDPDVVLLTGWHAPGLIQVLIAARLRGIPVLMRGDSTAMPRRAIGVRIAQHALFALVARFLVVGAANRELYRERGVAPSRLIDCPHVVDNARFAAAASAARAERAALRARYGVPEDACCFLFAGKLEPKKKPGVVLEAIARLSEREHERVFLLVVGSGALEAGLRQRASALRLPVSFAGFLNQSEMPKAYAAADALVLASDYGETWGLVVNEAMACGLTAVVSDRVGCGADLVTDGVTGYTFPFGDVAALAARMQALLQPELRARMAAAAEARVSQQYGIEQATAGVLAALASLPGAHSGV